MSGAHGTHAYDLVVAGGGPAGSTVASLVAMQGHRVLLLEKEHFPRYQIGESLLPSTVHGICRLLGVDDEMERAGFTVKRGGTFRWGTNPAPWTFTFALSPRLAGPTAYAYQVERMKFDTILLNHARRVGVQVREGTPVSKVLQSEGTVHGVEYIDQRGRAQTARARFFIDASGHRGRLHRAIGGLRRYSEFFRNIALFGYFEGGKRLPPPNSGNILSAAFDSGWFWYIPLSQHLTSVGAVIRHEMAAKVRGDPEQALLALIGECPLVAEYLADAHRVADGPYGQIRVRKDYSYCNTAFWRPGMALIGDAACFVDPVFSTGVHLATYSALLAARSINTVLAGHMGERRAFQEFEARYRREFRHFYEFLVSFYDLHVAESSYFWEARKVTGLPSSDAEAFATLVAGVASDEATLHEAGDVAARLAQTSSGLSRAVHQVAAQTKAGEEDMSPLFAQPTLGQAMRESAVIQRQALAGTTDGQESVLFEGGLVTSSDGMHWTTPPPQ
ncbi:tryptophan 7-halogenase [Streptomyces sp. NRRL B-1347]|uniref:tryptophan 7-halogenase n=1 Tax=Streptomyces sp. NRRL B-1347 TaxID=1476877 RepID=UPI0004C57CD9|nr:tryptophan 7-halogenase [Streptomyces sp. NRRL B-1347]